MVLTMLVRLMATSCLVMIGCHAHGTTMNIKDVPSFKPSKIAFKDLRSNNFETSAATKAAFTEALTTSGLIVVTGIDDSFGQLKRQALLGAHVCGKAAPEARTVTFDDGTLRTTLAATTRGVADSQPIEFGHGVEDESAPAACDAQFVAANERLRALVAEVAGVFVQRVDEAFNTERNALLWDVNGTTAFRGFEDIVQGATHLEHFHSYHLPEGPSNDDQLSIDMHADQGLFIAFTPALLVEDAPDGSAAVLEGGDAGAFLVELPGEGAAKADFEGDRDVLVLMLGDGVDHYINAKAQDAAPLRAAPHAMVMPRHTAAQSRVWYGRMFLPPDDALNEKSGLSFAQTRAQMLRALVDGNGTAVGAGCARQLAEDSVQCEDNQIYCWMRCMNFTEEVSPDKCKEQSDTGVQCMSARNEVWVLEDSHGDYWPTCSNLTVEEAPVTDPPTMAKVESDNGMLSFSPERCPAVDFAANFSRVSNYTHMHELIPGKYLFMWNVSDGVLHARLEYQGVANWLSIGAENHGGGHNGMNGASVVMAVNDAPTEEDAFGSPFIGGLSVKQYVIHERDSAFRWWNATGSTAGMQDEMMEVRDQCFTAAEFSLSSILDSALNLTANTTNDLIWALHKDTYLKGYHGYMNRGKIQALNFHTGDFIIPTPPAPPPAPPRAAPPISAGGVGTSVAALSAAAATAALALAVTVQLLA